MSVIFEAGNVLAMQKFLPPPPRALYLQSIALKMADSWTYTQATSLKYAPRLKRAAEVLARMVPGATFAKAWRPKPSSATYSKLYHHRGQVPKGWLSDAIQGRINCDSKDTVQQVAEFFRRIMDTQAAAADAAERPQLSEEPTGAEIQAYNLEGLIDLETELPVDALATYCQANMTPEGTPAVSAALCCPFLVCSLYRPPAQPLKAPQEGARFGICWTAIHGQLWLSGARTVRFEAGSMRQHAGMPYFIRGVCGIGRHRYIPAVCDHTL